MKSNKIHVLKTENYTHHFEETNNVSDIKFGGIEINGQANTISEFFKNMRLEQEWIPFGYCIKKVFRNKESKNMTAYLYRIGSDS